MALFPRLPRWGRVGALGFLGIQGVVAGTGGHVIHVLSGNAAPLDHSGVLFVLGGAILLTVAAAEARTRGKVLRPNDAGSAGSRPRPPREGSIGAGSRVAGGEHDA